MSYYQTFTGQDEPMITCETGADCQGMDSGVNLWVLLIIGIVCLIESCRHDKKDF